MSNRQKMNNSRFPTINVDKRICLGYTDEPPTDSTFSYLHFHLGLDFRENITGNSWLLGQLVLQGSGAHTVSLLATRHWDYSPGIDIEIVWNQTRPGEDLIIDYFDRVRSVLILAP